jgi:CRISPR system Cascade subunit CasD
MGIRREDEASLEPLMQLEFGVRVDQPGSLLRDFHVAQKSGGDPFLSDRFYLADAIFLAGLSGDEELLCKIESALKAPKFPIYLGRRSCPPTGAVVIGMRELRLEDALITEPWQASGWYQSKNHSTSELEIVIDSEEGTVTSDLPLSFNPAHRTYGYRSYKRLKAPINKEPVTVAETVYQAGIDWFAEIGGGD